MKKVLFYCAFVLLLLGCQRNPLIGSWQIDLSKEDTNMAVGSIQTITFEPNGKYQSDVEFQASFYGESTVVKLQIIGTWEMVDDSHYRVKTTKAFIDGEENENVTEQTYTILSLNDESFETMNEGKKKTYKRVKK